VVFSLKDGMASKWHGQKTITKRTKCRIDTIKNEKKQQKKEEKFVSEKKKTSEGS
jgi:hypothetical protein